MELADLTRGMQKNNFLEPEKLFFAKLGLSEFHESSAGKKKHRACFFAKPGLSEFHKISVQKNIFSELEKLFFCKAPTSSHKTIRGHASRIIKQ